VWPDDSHQPVITIVGPLDTVNTTEAAAYLDLALTHATTAITIDLTQVTLLASTAANLLFRVTEQAHALGLELTLIAPNGSPAQQILSLVHLPYQPEAAP
jgi:anti-anti-sigma regulatory factor